MYHRAIPTAGCHGFQPRILRQTKAEDDTAADGASRWSRRRGLTLVEVCLVLALLIVIGAIAAPLVEGSFSRARVQSGAELLRGAWARARLAAIQSGQTYVFRFEPRASRFQIITLDQLGMPDSAMIEREDPNAEHEVADMLRLRRSRLPDGVLFADGNISDSSQVLATLGATGQGAWSAPILFRPDGSTSDASVVLANFSDQTVRVTLRGLTGISNTSDVGREVVGP
jgi:type II secretory pathway pseudopilin PulG